MYKNTKGFLKILQRYIDNSSSVEEKQVMDYWYESIDQDSAVEKTADEKQLLEEKLWRQIQAKTQPHQPELIQPTPNWWQRNRYRLTAAASIVLIAGFIYTVSTFTQSRPIALKGLTTAQIDALTVLENTDQKPKQVQLSDGSQVTLESNATLYYPQSFNGDRRIVYLIGNGFFEIAKNPQKPFWVYSESIVTKVLGTSFTIRKNEQSGEVEVAVKSGRVIVEKSNEHKSVKAKPNIGVVLTPNEKVTYQQGSESYSTGLVDKPVLIDPLREFSKPDAFTFTEAPLSTVIKKLEVAYGIEITLINESVSDCPITAVLPNESLFAKLEVINALLNSTTELKGTTIVMTGGECIPFRLPLEIT
jgi:transmembrane sensor